MLAFGANITGFGVVNYFGANLDNFLVGRFGGAQQLGFYAKAYQLLLLPVDQINAPVAAVAVPALSRLVDVTDRSRRAYVRLLEKLTILTMPLAALMIGTSDWLIQVVLGPQWGFTARIFAILGFAAFLMPVMNSTGWLFISQNRTGEMLRWGFIDVIMKVVSVLIGLRWGTIGVAVAIVIRMYIQAPILFWYVGRNGPVRARDFYSAVAPAVGAFLCTLATLFVMRTMVEIENRPIGLLLALVVTVVVTLVTLISLPSGRLALRDIRSSVFLLVTRRTI
jgi:PST family polysaccharide transporter